LRNRNRGSADAGARDSERRLCWRCFSATYQSDGGVFGVLRHLSHSYTILPEVVLGWRWGNAVTSLLIPQRGFLLGIPLAAIVFTQWWAAARDTETGGKG